MPAPTPPPPLQGPRLSTNHVQLLGKISDRDLAQQAGCTEKTIAAARAKLGIEPYRPTRRRSERVVKESTLHKNAQTALSRWPHRLQGVGLDGNILLAEFYRKGVFGLTVTECRQVTRSHPLGMLARHGLVSLISRNPELRYAITDKGQEYHDLLKHAGHLTH